MAYRLLYAKQISGVKFPKKQRKFRLFRRELIVIYTIYRV